MMKYVPRDIRQFKLVTGDEILTEVVGEDHIEVMVRNPLKVFKERIVVKGIPREANFFSRWMGFVYEQEFLINKSHIVAEGLVDDKVAEYYNRMMDNVEQDDEVTIGMPSEAEHPEMISPEEEEDPNFKPTYH